MAPRLNRDPALALEGKALGRATLKIVPEVGTLVRNSDVVLSAVALGQPWKWLSRPPLPGGDPSSLT